MDELQQLQSIKSRIETFIGQGHLTEAKTLLDQLDGKLPGDTDVCSMRAVIHIMEGRLDEAGAVLQEGLKKDSLQFDLVFNLAYISELREQYQDAVDLYCKAGTVAIAQEQKQNVTRALERIKAIDKNIIVGDKRRIVFFVKSGLDNFLSDIMKGLSEVYWVRKIIVSDFKQIDNGMEWADICWFEWCDELVIYGSIHPLAKDRKIICRLHSYEAFTDLPGKVAWENINKVIFVAEHIRDIVLEKQCLLKQEQTIVIPNGIDMDKYIYRERKSGYNIAYVGYINYKKGPMLLLHTFKAIYDKDKRYKLFIAGKYQDLRYELYFRQMIKEFGMQENVFFEGWQGNIDEWLEDKNYILSTSVFEGHPVGLMEAMSRGIKPIIHNFVGAKRIYPAAYIWNTIDEAVDMVTSGLYDSLEYNNFIRNKYSLGIQLKRINDMILKVLSVENNKEKSFPNSDKSESTQCYDTDRNDIHNPVISYYNHFLDYLKSDRQRVNPRHTYLKRSLGSIIKSGDKVLDLGCGIGITTEYIKSLGVSKVIGVDLSPKLIEYAKNTVKEIEFIVHDITSLDLNEEFDVVVLCDVVEHVPMDLYNNLFRTIKNHLKKQGIVYMSIPDYQYQTFIKGNRPELLQIIDNCVSYKHIEQLCQENGLIIKFYNVYGIDQENQYNEYLLCDRESYSASWESLKLK